MGRKRVTFDVEVGDLESVTALRVHLVAIDSPGRELRTEPVYLWTVEDVPEPEMSPTDVLYLCCKELVDSWPKWKYNFYLGNLRRALKDCEETPQPAPSPLRSEDVPPLNPCSCGEVAGIDCDLLDHTTWVYCEKCKIRTASFKTADEARSAWNRSTPCEHRKVYEIPSTWAEEQGNESGYLAMCHDCGRTIMVVNRRTP